MKALMIGGMVCFVWIAGCNVEKETPEAPIVPASLSPIETGRYLVVIGGCNDCHTAGYLFENGNVPEEEWLLGSDIGYRGPWGTTYAQNLRMTVQDIDEEQWVEMLKTRKAMPPMPWMNVNKLSEEDSRAIYRYIHSLGAGGERMPVALGPDAEPETPYYNFVPQNIPDVSTE